MNIVPVILAGGGGSRLWPCSREFYPKQFLALTGESSLLQQTLMRLTELTSSARSEMADGFSVASPIVVSNEEHRFLVAEHARAVGVIPSRILLEPIAKNTAPALTIAAFSVASNGAEDILLMMPADHVIANVTAFCDAVATAIPLAADNYIVSFGIKPTHPETGYGYIRLGESLNKPIDRTGQSESGYLVSSFIEKPDLATATTYMSSGDYAWNSGIFLVKATVWLAAIKVFQPDIHTACELAYSKGQEDGDFYRLDKFAFSECPADSVDYAVMEKIIGHDSFKASVITLDAGWSDVGSWTGVWQISNKDDQGNAIVGDVQAIDSYNCYLRAEQRLLAVLGVDNLVVVETADAVLVASKDKSQEIKRFVETLKQDGREEHKVHRRVYRPWGSYEGIDSGDRFQVKRLSVKPGGKLSLQMHHHRAEHWIVVQGTACVTRGEEEFFLSENESTYIPLGVRHRLENPGTVGLEMIEVQSGTYLGEDDIVRFEDIYKRV
jgi:mannose-1-phosphate guanylyltransferase/mannose-6-phosphate isomerase